MTENFGNQDGGPLAVIDVHAHHFPRGLADRSRTTGDRRWPSLVVDDMATGRIMLGGDVFRTVRAPLWDVDARLRELDESGIRKQVVSPVPVALTYWADTRAASDFTRSLNDALAADVAGSGGRLLGLGAVPLQDVDAAIGELHRVMGELGLSGVEIGTTVAGRELDDPVLFPFFEAAAALGVAVLVHPMDGGGGAIRRGGQPYDFGLGMLTDTAMAAAALVFGGVLEALPGLRVALVHGCGTFPWAYPRLQLGAELTDAGAVRDHDELVRRLWVDALVFDPVHLDLLVRRFGPDHVMVGTDHPFVPGQLDAAPEVVRAACRRQILTEAQARAVLSTNAVHFLDGTAATAAR
ncbi:amidohydrolase family protein [Streptomyces sp. NPDC002143]